MTVALNPADAARAAFDCPRDFAYWEAIRQPRIVRMRRWSKRLLRYDPLPADDVVRAMTADMYAGDPVAERFVAEVFFGDLGPKAGRALLDRAIEHGIDAVPEAPESMRELFREFDEIPDWVDRELVEQGAAIWRRWGTTLFNVAGAETLEMYTERPVALPLRLAGGYAGDKALNRFLETCRFWIDVSQPGALFEPGSAGRATALRVRVMHVAVRQRVGEHAEWSYEASGLPISQTYMQLTLLGGSVAPALFMWPMGWLTSPSEIRALLHFQRYMGHVLGVRPRHYPERIRDAVPMVAAVALSRTHQAGQDGIDLIESFPRAFVRPQRRRGLAGLRDWYQYRLICGYCSVLMAPGTRRRHDMPSPFPWALMVIGRIPFVLASELLRIASPSYAAAQERRSCTHREAWLRDWAGGKDAQFDASQDLGR